MDKDNVSTPVAIPSFVQLNESLRRPLGPFGSTRLLWSAAAACAAIVAWVLAAALLNTSQLNDSLEQFVWGQALQWGYWKHPPLTSWIMWAALHATGPWPNTAYVLGALLTASALCCSVLIARELFGEAVAVYTGPLLALHYEFSRRAQVFNHNTVLVAYVALTALLTLRALKLRRDRDWIALGLAGGLTILGKYQGVVPLAGLLLVIVYGPWRPTWRQLAIATGVMALVLTPHLLWLWSHHFQALRYAADSVAPAEKQRYGHFVVSFLAMQLKYFLPTACFAVGLLVFSKRNHLAAAEPAHAQKAIWLVGLVAVPSAVVAIALAAGTPVQSHWGFQTTQFLLVGVAPWMVRRFGPWSRRHSAVWVAVQLLFLGTFIAESAGLVQFDPARVRVSALPASNVAEQANAWWTTTTGCQLKYVSGNVAWAGMVAAYSQHTVRVLEDGDPQKSPWINVDDMHRRGWIEVAPADGLLHPQGSVLVPLSDTRTRPHTPQRFLLLTAHLPTAGC